MELSGIRAVLAIPSYGMLHPKCEKSVRLAMMGASKHGLEWAGDASPDRMGFAAARNTVVQQFIEAGEGFADGIVWVDSDIVCEQDTFSRLLLTAKAYKADFVTGVYHKRGGDFLPLIYHFSPGKKKFYVFQDYPENVVAQVEGCGFGIVWTGVKAIETISRHPSFDPERGWFPDDRDHGGFGEDLNFCYQAFQAGVQLYVDTGIQVGHMGDPEIIARDRFLEARKNPKDELSGAKERVRWGDVQGK